MAETADASKVYRETSSAPSLTYGYMTLPEAWYQTDHIAWVSDGQKPPVLSRMWRRTETNETDWRPLETIIWPSPTRP